MLPEKKLERKVVKHIEHLGGVSLKLTGIAGIPDRLFIYQGRVSFVEFKRPDGGGVVSPAQTYWQNKLKQLSANATVTNNFDEAIAFITGS